MGLAILEIITKFSRMSVRLQRECITRTRRGDNPYSKSFRLFADQRVARASFDQIRDGD